MPGECVGEHDGDDGRCELGDDAKQYQIRAVRVAIREMTNEG